MEENFSPAGSVKPVVVDAPVESIKETKGLTFPQAMQKIIEGKKVTKLEWNNRDEYGFLKDSWLSIHRYGKDHIWQVSDGDLMGDDFIVLPEVN